MRASLTFYLGSTLQNSELLNHLKGREQNCSAYLMMLEGRVELLERQSLVVTAEIDQAFVHIDYFMTYLGESLLAIHEDGIPLAGAFAWGKY